MRYFYVDSTRQTVGPIPRQQLDLLAQQGAITGETLVVAEGGQAWIPLRTLAPEPANAAVPRPAAAAVPRPAAAAVPRPAAMVPPAAMLSPMRAATRATSSHAAPNPQPVVARPVTTVAATDGGLVDGIKAAFTHPRDLGQRLIAIGGAAGVVGFILPWITIPVASTSGWSLATQGDGRIFLALAVAISAIVIAGYLQHADTATAHRLTRIPIILGTAGLMVTYVVTSLTTTFGGGIGLGLWLTYGSFGAQLIGGWMVIGKEPTKP